MKISYKEEAGDLGRLPVHDPKGEPVMKPIIHSPIRRSIVVAAALAALAVPAGATAYPIIPDEPGDTAAAVGHDWMAKHPQKARKRSKPSSKPASTCHPKKSKASCRKP